MERCNGGRLCRDRLFYGLKVVDALEKGEEDDHVEEFLRHCASMDKSTLKLIAVSLFRNKYIYKLE